MLLPSAQLCLPPAQLRLCCQPVAALVNVALPGRGHEASGLASLIQTKLPPAPCTDAGPLYNPKEAYDAYRSLFKGQILMGVEVPPEAWVSGVDAPLASMCIRLHQEAGAALFLGVQCGAFDALACLLLRCSLSHTNPTRPSNTGRPRHHA